MKILYENALFDKFIFDVNYELIGGEKNVYTLRFVIRRRNTILNHNDENSVSFNYSASIEIIDKSINDVDASIYRVHLLDSDEDGYLAFKFLSDAAYSESLLSKK